jgi:glycine dehydrogenase subunit 1
VLQGLFEFQSMVCELTGLDVSNASLYDGATALVEAVNMSRQGSRGRVLVSAAVDPRYVQTLRAYGRGAGYAPEAFDAPGGRGGAPAVGDDVAAVIVQHPNAHGLLEPVRDLFGRARDAGARCIQIFDPLSLGVLASPGELGADIAVAEGQVLGNHLNYGGPNLGLIAARLDDVRRMPGRIVGETVDADGRTGYVLTLQAREQHIRREKANSNICTNQTLMALAATVYLAWLGPRGLEELGRQCAAKASYAAERLTAVDGVDLLFPGAPFFKEFALRLPRGAEEVRDSLIERGFLAGVPDATGDGRGLLVAVTERRTREEIDALAGALAEVLA